MTFEHICTKIWILSDIWHLSISAQKSRLNCFRGTAHFIFWRANILHFINTSCFSNKCTSFKTQVGPKHVSIIYFILFQKRISIEHRVLPSFIPYYPVSWVQKPIVHCFFYVCDKPGERATERLLLSNFSKADKSAQLFSTQTDGRPVKLLTILNTVKLLTILNTVKLSTILNTNWWSASVKLQQ